MKKATATRAPRQLSADKEQLLLDTAQQVFQEHGVSNATMDDIARGAGISKATIYRRYSSKTELFEKIVLQTSDLVADQVSNFELDPATPEKSIRAAAEVIREVVMRYSEFNRLLISEANRHSDLCQMARKRMNIGAEQKLQTFFSDLKRAGRMEHENLESATWTFFVVAAGGLRFLYKIDTASAEQKSRWQADIELYIRGCGFRPLAGGKKS